MLWGFLPKTVLYRTAAKIADESGNENMEQNIWARRTLIRGEKIAWCWTWILAFDSLRILILVRALYISDKDYPVNEKLQAHSERWSKIIAVVLYNTSRNLKLWGVFFLLWGGKCYSWGMDAPRETKFVITDYYVNSVEKLFIVTLDH